MATAYVVDFPGGTQEQYDAVLRELGVGLGAKPAPGQLFHAAGPYEGGWRVIDVWESSEVFDAYLNRALMPAVERSGMVQPQPPQVLNIYNMER